MINDLVFDIGMHAGVDTEYYLDLGYRVVGIEANPILAEVCKSKFQEAIAGERLFIENIGIHNEVGSLVFYVNKCDEWSSFNQCLGTRGGDYGTIKVNCLTLSYFVEKYGMPFFMKIDVEGVDEFVVRDLSKMNSRPAYISVEDAGIQCLIALYESGVRKFKFTNQPDAQKLQRPMVRSGPRLFGVSSSGPFGSDLPGEWMDTHSAFKYYVDNVRQPGHPPINGWWDIHGRYDP
jgi:FkbM family methyltransferase